jgi:hypothetical protein
VEKNDKRVRVTATGTIEARVNHTTLASLAIWADKNGYRPRTKSDLVRTGLETLVDKLCDIDPEIEVLSTEQAMYVLEGYGYGNLNRNDRGKRALANKLREDDKSHKSWAPVGSEKYDGPADYVPMHLQKLGCLPASEIMRRAAENEREKLQETQQEERKPEETQARYDFEAIPDPQSIAYESVEGLEPEDIMRIDAANRKAVSEGQEPPYPPIEYKVVQKASRQIAEKLAFVHKMKNKGCETEDEYFEVLAEEERRRKMPKEAMKEAERRIQDESEQAKRERLNREFVAREQEQLAQQKDAMKEALRQAKEANE